MNHMTILTLFLEGLLSFFSPCVLPLVPLYIAYLTKDAQSEDEDGNIIYQKKKTMWLTLGFVLGISVVFVIAGLSSQVLRQFFTRNQLAFLLVGGIILIAMALTTLGIIRIPFLEKTIQKQVSTTGKMTFLKAWVLGFFFSFAWSPCIGPMLAQAILQASIADTKTGWIYILSYCLGFILVFLLLGLFTNQILNWIKTKKDIVRYSKIISGVVVGCMGIYMLYQGYLVMQASQSSGQESLGEAKEENVEDEIDMEPYQFTLPDADGNQYSLKDYVGKPVIINFFGTWCGYCNLELPTLQKIHDEMEDVQIFLIVTPNVGSEGDIEYVEEYLKNKGVTIQVLYDTTLEVSKTYGISGYPTTFIVKADGEFLGYIPGYMDEENLFSVLEQVRNQ